MSELKPCPFCDGPATYVTVFKIAGDYSAAVICERCNAKTDFMCANDEEDAKVMAAACWNARAERTCENTRMKSDQWLCSECGGNYDIANIDLDRDEDSGIPSYCPNCGAKVVSE